MADAERDTRGAQESWESCYDAERLEKAMALAQKRFQELADKQPGLYLDNNGEVHGLDRRPWEKLNSLLVSVIGDLSLAKLDLVPETMPWERLEAAERSIFRMLILTDHLLRFFKGGSVWEEERAVVEVGLEEPVSPI